MIDETLKNEIEVALKLSQDDLFACLVTGREKEQLYSRDGLISKGKEIFNIILPRIRDSVCDFYHSHMKLVEHSVDMACLLAMSLYTQPITADLPVIPLAAILVKIGLDKICLGYPKNLQE